jgi:hypothetical protein
MGLFTPASFAISMKQLAVCRPSGMPAFDFYALPKAAHSQA